ncbi:HsmA family protein [Clostridium sp.]|uniref:HsmA family protein n=1 Tax=Clostridium sp. TaxID=1506 RepID=UPI003D6C79CB
MLVFSIVLVNFALIIYTISIFSEFRRKTLLPWHVGMVSIGLICDVFATFIMYRIGGSMVPVGAHGLLGYIALVLMLINTIGSILTLKKYRNLINQFYKFSMFAWAVWVISYVAGILAHV